jgi:hypothetical protein
VVQVKDADRLNAVRFQFEYAPRREGFRPGDTRGDASALQQLNQDRAACLIERRSARDAKHPDLIFQSLFLSSGQGSGR